MKTRYFIQLSYNGAAYHGWQLQPNSVTIQKIVNEALSTILNEEINVTGAGRTDTGVHALSYFAHFDSFSSLLAGDNNLIFKLNRYLPKDISVNSIRKVTPDAHARFSALSRTYKYYLSGKKDPFRNDFSWYLYGKIDIFAMNESCEIIKRQTDFTSFCKLHSDTKTNVCNIIYAGWEEADSCLIFTIKADRFLRNMVRSIVGTMTEVGFGKMSLKEFEDIINKKNRCSAGQSAPAKALFLTDIEYPDEIYI